MTVTCYNQQQQVNRICGVRSWSLRNNQLCTNLLYNISEQAPNVSFTQGTYSVREGEEVLTVSIERSGDSDSHVMVLIATHPSEGTATGQCIVYVI